jgi:hypothetical protein
MGNFSRDTFDKLKHYVGVRLQQGVPIVDADWNEMEDIRKYELQAFLKWFIGNGVPLGNDGFRIVAVASPNNFAIRGGDGTADGVGRCLVEGWDVMNSSRENTLNYTTQRLYNNNDLATAWNVPPLPPLTTPGGNRTDTVYLDVWEREVDSREDPDHLVNPAIGLETAVRIKREWVVRVNENATVLPNPPTGHVFYPLATLTRPAGNESITDAMITDRRQTGINLSALQSMLTVRTDPGRVGIGTNEPETRLHVSGGQWNVTDTEGDFKIGSATHRLKIGVATGGGGAGDVRIRAAGGTNRLLLGGGTNDVLTIRDNGRFGVNVPEPETKLHVSGGQWNVTATEGDFKIGDATHRLKIGVATGGGGAGDVRIRAMGGTNRLLLGGGTADVLTVTAENVGIGTITPGSRLHVNGPLAVAGDINITNVSNLNFADTSSTRQMINLWGSSAYGIGLQTATFYFRTNEHFTWYRRGSHDGRSGNPGEGGQRLMTLNAAGDLVLSARTNPNNVAAPEGSSCRALVDGNQQLIINYANDFNRGVLIQSDLQVTGVARRPGGGPWTAASDVRLKQSIQPLEGALDKLLRLHGVQFEWVEPATQGNLSGPQMGMIAQEVEAVFPEWVSMDPQGFKEVTLRGFEALAVEAVRQLKVENEALLAQNRELESRVRILEAGVAAGRWPPTSEMESPDA